MGSLNPDIVCKRCGECCHYFDEQGIKRKCRMLIQNGNTSVCRIYKTRLGHKIAKFEGKVIACIDRKVSKYDYPDCPYNTNKALKDKN